MTSHIRIRMFRKAAIAAAALAAASCATAPPPARELADADLAASSAIADEFQQRLGLQLMTALREAGPVAAIEVCAQVAPAIAESLSDETGTEVRRISLAPRNPGAIPEPYLEQPLRDLQARPLTAEGKPRMIGWIEGSGTNARQITLRSVVMQEQPCSVCHGKSIAPEVQAAIDANYPADMATGFSAGELRGAILIARSLTPAN